VQLSSDGVPFIFHDDVFDRLTVAKGRSGARAIAEVQTLTLIGSSTNEVPQRFTEFLAQVAGRHRCRSNSRSNRAPKEHAS